MRTLVRRPRFFHVCILLLTLGALCGVRAEEKGFNFRIRVNDPYNLLGSDTDGVRDDLQAAMQEWGQYIWGRAPLVVELRVVTRAGRFGGRSANGVNVVVDGHRLIEEGAANKLRTGHDPTPSQPDIVIEAQPTFMRQAYWIDPHPLARTDTVPLGRIDLVTVFAHEIGHALGFNGRLERGTGRRVEGLSLYDAHVVGATSGAPVFRGRVTRAVYGADLPLTFFFVDASTHRVVYQGHAFLAAISRSQNLYHYGRFTQPGESGLSMFGLMAGAWIFTRPDRGLRIPIGPLDVAVLEDLGVPTRIQHIRPDLDPASLLPR